MTRMQVHSWQAHRSSQLVSCVSKPATNGTNRDISGEEAFVEKDKTALTSEFPCSHDPICAIRGQSFFVLSESELCPVPLWNTITVWVHYLNSLLLEAERMKYSSRTKCPQCGSEQVAAIIYAAGIDVQKVDEDIRSRRAVPAGRPPTGNDPRCRCLKCQHEWGHPRGQSGAALDPRELA